MSSCVVDTDVVSYLFKSATEADLYRPHLTGKLLVISFMTVAELEFWALDKNWGPKRIAALHAHMQRFVVYPFDVALCRTWAQVQYAVGRKGRHISPTDAWIAATALLYSIPLVTNNRKDFEAVDGITLISES